MSQTLNQVESVAVLGAGVIGASWTALFLAAGLRVRVFDVADGFDKQVSNYVDSAWPTLQELDLATKLQHANLSFHHSASQAVTGAEFVQENIPEQLALKHALYAEIEPHLLAQCIVASSASGLMVKELQQGFSNPSRFIVGHPFNPPHLIPLVELLGNESHARRRVRRC